MWRNAPPDGRENDGMTGVKQRTAGLLGVVAGWYSVGPAQMCETNSL
jgi:hypothetical protein